MSTRRSAIIVMAIALCACRLAAQDEPPPIGHFVVDVRGTVPVFKKDVGIAASRGLLAAEMPGAGLGADAGVHVYVLKWKAITFGLGGQVTVARAHASPAASLGLRAVTERFTTVAPQLSLNFGTGDGWSYLSAGLGPSWWTIVPDGSAHGPADEDRLRTANFGGGARWFAKRHTAFTFDVRFYQIDPGFPHGGFPGTPRIKFIVIGAGASIR